MSHYKNLGNRKTGIRRLAENVNILILELGINNYGNCALGQQFYKCRQCKNNLKSKIMEDEENTCEVEGNVSAFLKSGSQKIYSKVDTSKNIV